MLPGQAVIGVTGRTDGFPWLDDGSGDEDFPAVPIEVLAGGGFGSFREEYHLAQRWSSVVLPGQWIGPDGVRERTGEVDAQSAVDHEHAGVEGDAVAGQAARPLRGSRRSAGELSFHGLKWPASSIRKAPNEEGRRPQNTQRQPQLASTCRANKSCPTRAAAGRIRSDSRSNHTLVPRCWLIWSRRPGSSTEASSSSWRARGRIP